MEYRTIIYNAARDGNLRRLKVFLDCRVADEVKNLLTASTLGTPPLVIASRNGHLECCKYLVEKGADLELAGSVTFDGENIEGAPPLWCASAAGHYEVVVFLVSSGANVNNTTVTNSTPLRAACFDGHLKIVKYLVEQGADMEIANSHGHTSLMIACYRGHPEVVEYLLQKGADVNRRSVKGNTAMHDCAESGSLEIMRLLLDHGAKMERDAYGLTPLIAAACVGNSAVVDFLVQCPKCSLQERVDALELLGANYIDKKRDIIGAIQYWRRALLLRTMHSVQVHAARLTELGCTDFKFLSITETAGMADSFDPENIPAEELKPLKPKKRDPVPAYKNQVEFENAAELDALRSDPDAIRMQALCIRERILGPAHPDTSYYIRYRGAVYADIGNCQRCIELWLYALDMQQRTLEPLCSMTLSSFISFAELFSFMLNDSFTNRPAPNNNINANPPEHPHGENADVDGQPGAAAAAVNNNFLQAGQKPAALCFEQIITVVDRAVEEIRKGIRQQTDKAPVTGSNCKHSDKESAGSSNVQRMNLITLHLICQMCRLESRMSPEEHQRLKKTVYSLLALDPRDVNGGPSLLQLACNFDSSTIGRYPVCRFPSLSVVQLLLSVGADVNATDGQGNTALHTVLSNKVARPSIVRCLLEAGGHIDSKNRAGVTPLDLLKQGSCDTCPMNYMTLKCFAAQAIMKNNLGYRGNSIPTHLHNFVAMH